MVLLCGAAWGVVFLFLGAHREGLRGLFYISCTAYFLPSLADFLRPVAMIQYGRIKFFLAKGQEVDCWMRDIRHLKFFDNKILIETDDARFLVENPGLSFRAEREIVGMLEGGNVAVGLN